MSCMVISPSADFPMLKTVCVSSTVGRPPTCLLQLDELLSAFQSCKTSCGSFMDKKSFCRFSMGEIPFKGILWMEDLLWVFYIKKTPFSTSIAKRGFSGLLELQEFIQTLYRWRSLYRSITVRRLANCILLPTGLL